MTLLSTKRAKKYFKDKINFTTGPMELHSLITQQKPISIIDVRKKDDYDICHIPGAINLPKDQWHSLKGLSKNRTNILYCYSEACHLAATAAVEFTSKGYTVMELEGGFETWNQYELPIEH